MIYNNQLNGQQQSQSMMYYLDSYTQEPLLSEWSQTNSPVSPLGTTVIINQHQPQPIRDLFYYKNEWSTSVCDCFKDCKICLCVFFFGYCYNCYLHSQANENCCTPICCPFSLANLRTKIRTHYRIDGSICEDYCCTAFCAPCSTCQMANELKSHGIDL